MVRQAARPLDAVLQILFEIAAAEKVQLDETAVKGPLDQNSQLAHPEHGNSALPAVPDVARGLGLQFVVRVAQKAPDQIPIEFSAQGDHGEGLAHAGPDEFFGIRIENDVAERLRIAIEQRGHDTVACQGDPVTENRIDLIGGTPQELRQRSVAGLFPPLPQ